VPAVANGSYQVTVTNSSSQVSNGIQFTVLAAKLIPVTFTVFNASPTQTGDYIFLTGNTVELSNWATTWDADISAPRIRSDVETSLRVFGGERLDLYYLHRVDLAEQPVEEGIGALASLRDEGKLARIGLSNVGVAELERASTVARIDAVQNHHSAMGRESLEVLAWCEANEVPFFAYSPLRPAAAAPRLTALADTRGVSLQRLQLRALLALLVLAVAIRFGLTLVLPPSDTFSMAVLTAGGAN